ncbi:CAAX geranylgeranyltransferase alpha subunit [Ascosphaera atra]|nr:CAAX geranylgeranyltransferase alpha subunit [Ascosphaera atra]
MVATKYSESEAWADITPIPLNDGSTHYAEIGDSITPLVSIAYPEEYSEAMSYLRAIMAKNEMSDRALELTEHIIKLNPAHYTVW